MATNERNEEVEALELQRSELQERFDDDSVSEADFRKAMTKIDFQLAQIRQSVKERGAEPKQDRAHQRDRGRDFFNE